jgi:hypothetical protein
MVTSPRDKYDRDDIQKIAKRWYTEQRGRIVGNTPAWDDLTRFERASITNHVDLTLRTMQIAWGYHLHINMKVIDKGER